MNARKAVRLTVADRASYELNAIEEYSIAEWGDSTATKYIDRIQEALVLIQDSPGILHLHPALPESLRYFQANRHLLIFMIFPDELLLLTIVHGSSDLASRLRELRPEIAQQIEIRRQKLDGH